MEKMVATWFINCVSSLSPSYHISVYLKKLQTGKYSMELVGRKERKYTPLLDAKRNEQLWMHRP